MVSTICKNILTRTDDDVYVAMSFQAMLNHTHDESSHELKHKHDHVNN